MKQVLTAVVALAFGAGLAVAAQAAGTARHSGSSQPGMHAGASAKMNQTRSSRHMSQRDVRQAQQRLKALGFYKGRIDGDWGPQTQRAVAQFQKQHNLPRTANLDRKTWNELTSGRTVGVGSGMPRRSDRMHRTQASGKTNASTRPAPAAPSRTQAPGAGSSTPASDQHMQHSAPSTDQSPQQRY